MMTGTLIEWLLISAALCISTYALIVALRTSDRSLSKRLYALSTQLSETADIVEQLTLQIRNLRARASMASMRERKKELSANGSGVSSIDTTMQSAKDESADDRWARETNLAIATGKIRPFGR